MTARSATRSRTVPPTAINGGSRASAYQQIKEAILGGVLRPLERITEGSVAARLGLSRTPVREAFGVLAAEGLIVVVPQRGSFVSQLSIEDILEIYQVRTPLECMAARIAANWSLHVESFVKVMPSDYRRVLDARRRAEERGEDPVEAVMSAAHG